MYYPAIICHAHYCDLDVWQDLMSYPSLSDRFFWIKIHFCKIAVMSNGLHKSLAYSPLALVGRCWEILDCGNLLIGKDQEQSAVICNLLWILKWKKEFLAVQPNWHSFHRYAMFWPLVYYKILIWWFWLMILRGDTICVPITGSRAPQLVAQVFPPEKHWLPVCCEKCCWACFHYETPYEHNIHTHQHHMFFSCRSSS